MDTHAHTRTHTRTQPSFSQPPERPTRIKSTPKSVHIALLCEDLVAGGGLSDQPVSVTADYG